MKEVVLDHPLITHKLSILRNVNTCTKEFRELIKEISVLLCYEATKDINLKDVTINTPMEKYHTKMLVCDDFAFVPILRAGLSMVDGIINIIPNARVGHIGLYRNEETLKPVEYYYKMPKDINRKTVFLLDPMLATGGSAIAAVDKLKESGATKIKFLCIIAAPEGLEALKKAHPDVEIFAATVDRCLSNIGYIMPGLGDAGDRVYGTK